MRRIILALTVSIVGVTTAMAIEEPEYEVVATTDDYEIRRYEPFIVAETEIPGEFGSAGNDAFRILAGYIFGRNRSSAVTSTVTRQSAEETSVRMAMTAPVVSTAPNLDPQETHVYGFVMPAEYDLESLPIPLDPRVNIRTMPARIVAVRRYSGRWNLKGYEANETALRDALKRDGLLVKGEPTFARYNAPYTPWFMRRNEVIFEIEPYLSEYSGYQFSMN
jgi:hypothetical protein